MRKNVVLMKIVVVAIVIFALTSVALSVGDAAEVNQLPVDGAWVLKETIKDPMAIAETGTRPTSPMMIPAETPPYYFNYRAGIDDSSAYFNWSWVCANWHRKGGVLELIETFCTGQVHEKSTWTIPPSTLVPGQAMKTDLEASFTASQDVIKYHPSCDSGLGGHCIRFSLTARGYHILPVGPCVHGRKNELSKKSSKTVEWSVPQGIPGDTLEIKIAPITTGMGRSDNAIHFIYEYKEEASTTTPPAPPETPTITETVVPEITLTPGNDQCEDLKNTLSGYMNAKNLTVKSISDYKKQLDVLSGHSAFNTGYLNEYQNNTLGDTPDWSKKNLFILKHGAGGGSASYLINKEKWKNQLNKSIQLQTQNLQKIDSEIAKVKREIQQRGCK